MKTVTGDLTWNANGSLKILAITDQLNTPNSQTCNYTYDDLARVASANCGATTWSQTFSFDPFGNIKKTVPQGSTGTSFQPTYSLTTNRYQSVSGCTPAYDANGFATNDCARSYTWDSAGNPRSIDTVNLTYDALGRMIEQASGSSYTQIVYGATGGKLALMNGQTLRKAFVPLPGGATAVYISTGLSYYRHSDWLGSGRLATTTTRTMLWDVAYAPYGETYASSGTIDPNFTGQNQDTVSNIYDFLFREYNAPHGRWPWPDPAGMGAVNPESPQTWNRYAYVANQALSVVDALGLHSFNDALGSGGGICIEGPACAYGPYGSSTYIVNGIQMSAVSAQGLLSMGAAGQCPNNNCDRFNTLELRIGADNSVYGWQTVVSGQRGLVTNPLTGEVTDSWVFKQSWTLKAVGFAGLAGAPPPNDPSSIFTKWATKKINMGPKPIPKNPPWPGTNPTTNPARNPVPPEETVPLPWYLYILQLINNWPKNGVYPLFMVDPCLTQHVNCGGGQV